MKLLSWQELEDHPAVAAGNVLDVRDRAAFDLGHLRGAVSLPVPVSTESAAALSEALPAVLLPPRREPLLVYGDGPAHVTRIVAYLEERGRVRVGGAALAAEDAPARRWVAGGPPGALWRPPAFLAEHIGLLPPGNAGPVVDFGCGGGRAAVWLAERNYDVTAVDRLEDALDLARRLARHHGVELQLLRRDLAKPHRVPAGPWAAALAFQFLHRDLLRRLPELLQPRGVAMVHTFRWVAGEKSLPRRKHCLEDGELHVLFPASSWEVLVHVKDRDDEGRPAAGLVARLR